MWTVLVSRSVTAADKCGSVIACQHEESKTYQCETYPSVHYEAVLAQQSGAGQADQRESVEGKQCRKSKDNQCAEK